MVRDGIFEWISHFTSYMAEAIRRKRSGNQWQAMSLCERINIQILPVLIEKSSHVTQMISLLRFFVSFWTGPRPSILFLSICRAVTSSAKWKILEKLKRIYKMNFIANTRCGCPQIAKSRIPLAVTVCAL